MFPDDEALIQAEFEKTLDFHLGLAGRHGILRIPNRPWASMSSRSTSTRTTSTRRTGRQSLFDFKFAVSYGNPQEVRVLAKRDVGRVTLKYRINGGGVRSARTRMGRGRALQPRQQLLPRGARHGDRHRSRDTVKVWFDGGREESDSFTYDVVSDSGNDVLVLSAGGLHGRLAGPTAGANSTCPTTRTR